MKPNSLVKFGLVLIVASLAAIAGNYTTTLRPEGYINYPRHVNPTESSRSCQIFKSYSYEALIDSGGGEVRFMVVNVWDFLASGGDIEKIRNCLVNVTVSGSERVTFKPNRRGVYITIIENPSEEELFVGYALTFTREPEIDFIQDSLLITLFGSILTAAGLALEKLRKSGR